MYIFRYDKQFPLFKKTEIVALINTLAKFSESIEAVVNFRQVFMPSRSYLKRMRSYIVNLSDSKKYKHYVYKCFNRLDDGHIFMVKVVDYAKGIVFSILN